MVKLEQHRNKALEGSVFFEPLSDEEFTPDFTKKNIEDKDTFQSIVKRALEKLGDERANRISLVLPDNVSRLFVLDFDDVPSKESERQKLFRHRVRKVLPFDPETSVLSYNWIKSDGRKQVFLVGFMYRPVVRQYEEYLGEIGLHCGLIDTRSNNLLNLYKLDSEQSNEARLFILLDFDYMTAMLENNNELLLYRGKGLPKSGRAAFVKREILLSIMYWFDHLGGEEIPGVVVLENRDRIEPGDITCEKGRVDIEAVDLRKKLPKINITSDSRVKIDPGYAVPAVAAAMRSYRSIN